MKKLLTSGDGELFMIKGQGKIWIQSKTKIEYKKDKFWFELKKGIVLKKPFPFLLLTK